MRSEKILIRSRRKVKQLGGRGLFTELKGKIGKKGGLMGGGIRESLKEKSSIHHL